MGTDSTSRTIITIAVLAVLAGAIWLIRDILPPFIIAFALALLLDPLLDRMQRWGVPRPLAVGLTFLTALLLFFGVTALLLPHLIGQITELVDKAPAHATRIQHSIDVWTRQNEPLLRRMHLPTTLDDLWRQHEKDLTNGLQWLLQRAIAALQASVGALAWVIVVPLVTLYLLIDLDLLKARVLHLLGSRDREVVADLATKVGHVFAAYLRGLTTICVAYGLLVYVVLGAGFRLEYALILAIAGTVMYAVPVLGQLALLLVSVVIAWATGHKLGYIIGVAVALVLIGQLFDQLITPRTMGKQVGLHPVLGLFALTAGNHLFGLPGMVIAVPVAASIRVVLLHLFPRLGEPITVPRIKARRRKGKTAPDETEPSARPAGTGRQERQEGEGEGDSEGVVSA